MFCVKCGKEIDNEAVICPGCGVPTHNFAKHSQPAKPAQSPPKPFIPWSQQAASQPRSNDGAARCPKCGSTSLSANKKGFGIGKAVVGAATLGGIGLVAGNMGARKLWVTCLNCGKRWKV